MPHNPLALLPSKGSGLGKPLGGEWVKPSLVLMGECNYSDAHLFPVEYKVRGLGQTLGMAVKELLKKK
jgi:tricorn protease